MSKKKPKRKFQKTAESFLRFEAYATPTLLQRVEEGMRAAGTGSRSELICTLLDRWAAERGC